jgi:hypothetical protein
MTHMVRVIYAISQLGFGRCQAFGMTLAPVEHLFSVGDKPIEIREEGHAWVAQLGISWLIRAERFEEAARLAIAIHAFYVARAGSGAVPTLCAACDMSATLVLTAQFDEARALIEAALEDSLAVRGVHHPETLRLAAVALATLVAASATSAEEGAETLGRARELVDLFDVDLDHRSEQFGYASLNQSVLSWEGAKTMLRIRAGERQAAVDEWPALKAMLTSTFGRCSYYAASYTEATEGMLADSGVA